MSNEREICANCGNVYEDHLLHDGRKCHAGSVTGWFPNSVAIKLGTCKIKFSSQDHSASVAAPTSEEVEEYNSKMWEAAACGRHGNRYCESDQVWDSTCVHCAERFTAIRDYTASLEARVDCGHPASLLIKSVESDYTFCELCEVKSERRDALQMEAHYKAQRDALAASLRDVREKYNEAMATANGRWCEWGGRAESTADVLDELGKIINDPALLSRIRTNTNSPKENTNE